MNGLLDLIAAEIERARARYGAPTSTHESYGVLAEEVAELLCAVHENNLVKVKREAIQVAAVAMRMAAACDDEEFARRSRK